MGKFYSLLLLFLLPVSLLRSQDPCASLNYHAFKSEVLQGTYTDLQDQGTALEVSNLDDGIADPQEIGFEFVYHCQSFTQFILNTNGFIKLGAETTPKTSLFFSNAQSTSGGLFSNADSNNVNLIAVFDHDIESATGTPDFRFYTSGTAPHRVCTIQWKNMREWSADTATKQYVDMDFQLKLYETSNVIEFIYGEWGASNNPSNYKTAACGLKGTSNADDQLLVVVKSSAAHWDNVTFHNGNYAPNESFNFGNPPDRPKPKPGVTYRFTPTYHHDLAIREVYALGNASSYYSSPQTISATVQNKGFDLQYDIPVILEVSGANSHIDTQYISTLSFTDQTLVSFPGYAPSGNGQSEIKIYVGDDDGRDDNSVNITQHVSDLDLNYATQDPASRGYGFLSGVQGIYYNKYPVHGSATVNAVNVYIADDPVAVGKTVFGAVLNDAGALVARSDNYVIAEGDLGTWLPFAFATPPVIENSSFYAGFGMTSSPVRYSPLGIQDETPARPGTYYTSLITGNGLKEMDLTTFPYRFMIGASLNGAQPVAGPATGDTTICAYGIASITLEEYSGFITWQTSPDGLGSWQAVQDGSGLTSANYATPELTASAYYRAAVFQPGSGVAYSNAVYVEVVPPTPTISSSGDALQSSTEFGNQWYNQDGLIPGATGQVYLVLTPGTYYVKVTSGECVSAPSNEVEIITVATQDPDENSKFKIYPNPVGDELYVDMDGLTGTTYFEFFNAQGQSVRQGLMQPGTPIKTHWMSPGVYIIRLQIGSSIELHKLVKE